MGVGVEPPPVAEAIGDYRDLTIQAAVLDLVLAQDRIRSLEEDLAVSREVLVASLDALRESTVRYDRLRARHQELANDYRRFREERLIASGALDSEPVGGAA